MLQNRIQAGQLLSKKLVGYKNEKTVVVAIPNGGIPIGYYIAKELGVPLAVLPVQKIGHPNNPEHTIGAAGLTDYFIATPKGISKSYITKKIRDIHECLRNFKLNNHEFLKIPDLHHKTVLLVDDGMVSGATLLYAIRQLQKSQPKEIIVAVPVASHSAVAALQKEVAAVIVVIIPPFISTVAEFYKNYDAISAEEVNLYLQKIKALGQSSQSLESLKTVTMLHYKNKSQTTTI